MLTDEELIRLYRDLGPDVEVHVNSGHLRGLRRIEAAVAAELKEKLAVKD